MERQYIKIPRRTLEELLKDARQIAAMDKSEHPDSGAAYAHALGRCNGTAKGIVAALEVCLEAK